MEQHHEGRRDYLYYLALGEARMKNYDRALQYCRAFLEIEENPQVRSLEVFRISFICTHMHISCIYTYIYEKVTR